MNNDEAATLLNAVADMIEAQKLPENGNVLVKEAEGGFNLCCDMTAHKIRELVKLRMKALSGAV